MPSGYKAENLIEQTASGSPTAGGAETLNALSSKFVHAQIMPSGDEVQNLMERTASSSPTAGGAGGWYLRYFLGMSWLLDEIAL